mmetsp:Transcript_30311/g.67943  ORF Transcript_30311/g.67943 Transcript_30311/m.67943 type:complete len:309 (-) Transcript_30311:245-1171(-)
MPRLHRRKVHRGGHSAAGLRGAGGVGHPGPGVRHDPAAQPADAQPQDAGDRRGRRDAQPGLQGADLRHLPIPAPDHPGGAGVGDASAGGAGHDQEVHERARARAGEARRAHSRGHQAVLRSGGARGVEVRHALRPVRHVDHHAGGHLLQHQEEGGLAHRQDARGQLHGVGDARGHAPAGARRHHGGVPVRRLAGHDRHRRVGPRPRRAAGLACHLVRPAEQPRAVHPPHRPLRALRSQGRGHQLPHPARRALPARHRAVLQHPDRGDAHGHRRPHLTMIRHFSMRLPLSFPFTFLLEAAGGVEGLAQY